MNKQEVLKGLEEATDKLDELYDRLDYSSKSNSLVDVIDAETCTEQIFDLLEGLDDEYRELTAGYADEQITRALAMTSVIQDTLKTINDDMTAQGAMIEDGLKDTPLYRMISPKLSHMFGLAINLAVETQSHVRAASGLIK